MSKIKCAPCNGTGYCSPIVAPDTPSMLRPIGCWPCSLCRGSGEHQEFILTPEMMKSIEIIAKENID